jgi:hypothetical protein
MMQGAVARREMRQFLPERRVLSRRAASKFAFLRSLNQTKWDSALPVEAVPVGLVRYVIAVSEAHSAPFRRRRKLRGVATNCGDCVARPIYVIGKPHPRWSGLLQIYS